MKNFIIWKQEFLRGCLFFQRVSVSAFYVPLRLWHSRDVLECVIATWFQWQVIFCTPWHQKFLFQVTLTSRKQRIFMDFWLTCVETSEFFMSQQSRGRDKVREKREGGSIHCLPPYKKQQFSALLSKIIQCIVLQQLVIVLRQWIIVFSIAWSFIELMC